MTGLSGCSIGRPHLELIQTMVQPAITLAPGLFKTFSTFSAPCPEPAKSRCTPYSGGSNYRDCTTAVSTPLPELAKGVFLPADRRDGLALDKNWYVRHDYTGQAEKPTNGNCTQPSSGLVVNNTVLYLQDEKCHTFNSPDTPFWRGGCGASGGESNGFFLTVCQ